MKTLKESLFDSDLGTRDLTLGNIFEFIPQRSTVGAKYYIDSYRNVPITDCIDIKSLKRDTKVSGSDDKVILNGFAKLFLDIKFIPDYTSRELCREYKELVDKYLHFDRYEGKNHIIIQFYKTPLKFPKDLVKIGDSKEVNLICVILGGSVTLFFERA